MMLYRLAGRTNTSAEEERSLLDAAVEAHKCGLRLTGTELLDLDAAERAALAKAWDIVFNGAEREDTLLPLIVGDLALRGGLA